MAKPINPHKLLTDLIEEDRLHIALSRDKRLELMKKLSPAELINSLECLLYRYESLIHVQNLFEEYKIELNNLISDVDLLEAEDLRDAQELWKNFLNKVSELHAHSQLDETDEEEGITALKELYEEEEEDKKGKPLLQGPINDLFYKQGLMVVYGTLSPDEKYRETLVERAHSFLDILDRKVKIKIYLKKDVNVTSEDIKNFHLILFGGPGVNEMAEQIGDELPLSLEEGQIQLGDMKFVEEDTRLIMLSVNPLNPSRYVLLYTALGFEGVKDLYGLHHGPTDFVIGNKFNWLARGFFDKTDESFWQYAPDNIEVNDELMNFLDEKIWETTKTSHYNIIYQKNSTAYKHIKEIIKMHEDNYPLLIQSSELSPDKMVDICLYETNEQKEQITGVRFDGSFDTSYPRIHMVYNDSIIEYGPEKLLYSLYKHIRWP